jgi:hypothetical protein
MSGDEPFPVYTVSREARVGHETMGTKQKFWWRDDEGVDWLFKFARSGTGEHWSEKVGAEIGALLGIPCARVELATCDGHLGSLSRGFVEAGQASLVHGNELLQEVDECYPTRKMHGVSRHTVDAVLQCLEGATSPCEGEPALVCAADWFLGYLLLDAVIVNSDRHHQNWGVLQLASGERRLAPSYDHASSLGRELRVEECSRRLTTRDPAFSAAGYVRRARSALHADETDRRPLHPAAAFSLAGARRPAAMAVWRARLARAGDDSFERIIARVPDEVIRAPARAFALAVLRAARHHLLDTLAQTPSERP